MRLIIDAQLPSKLCEILNQLGIESIQWINFQKEMKRLILKFRHMPMITI